MTSPYLTRPLRTELEAGLALRGALFRFPCMVRDGYGDWHTDHVWARSAADAPAAAKVQFAGTKHRHQIDIEAEWDAAQLPGGGVIRRDEIETAEAETRRARAFGRGLADMLGLRRIA